MTKEHLARKIAEQGYNAGYTAKLNFASYDMLRFLPGLISFASMAVGVLGLVSEMLSSKVASALLLVVGLVGYYITVNEKHLKELDQSGKELTSIYNKLSVLHANVKSATDDKISEYEKEFSQLQEGIGKQATSRHAIFSGWYAHLKFFGEGQPDWVVEELKLTFFKDKIPASLKVVVAIIAFLAAIYGIYCGLHGVHPAPVPVAK